MLGTPPLDVPEIAGFSEQTYKFGAFVPVFGLFSEQIFIRVRPAKLRYYEKLSTFFEDLRKVKAHR